MSKKELINTVAAETKLPKSEVRTIVNEVLSTIQNTLVNGSPVQFPGFGTFSIVERAARKGRNPQTGESIKIDARNAVKFKVGTALKKAINE